MLEDRENILVSEGEAATLPEAATVRPSILVAEDDEAIRTLLEWVLESYGFTVWLARDGQEALELFGRVGHHIDIVLVDVCMPRMNGPLAVQAMRRLKANLRCCFMSGNLADYTEKDLWDLGALRIFDKPFSMATAAKTLRRLARVSA